MANKKKLMKYYDMEISYHINHGHFQTSLNKTPHQSLHLNLQKIRKQKIMLYTYIFTYYICMNEREIGSLKNKINN